MPEPVVVQALVDTRASCLCIDRSVLQKLGLGPTGSSLMSTPSTGATPATVDLYDVSFSIFSTQEEAPLSYRTIPAIETQLLESQGFHVLIGRDVLKHCMLVFDGRNGRFSLAF